MELHATKNDNGKFAFFSGIFLICLTLSLWRSDNLVLLVPFAIIALYSAWTDHRLLFFVLLFTLPISTEIKITGELSTDFPDEILMILVTGVLIASLILTRGHGLRKYMTHPIILFFLLTIVWSIAAISASDYPIISIKYLLAKTWYAGAFLIFPFIILKNKKDIIVAVRTLCFTMFAVVLIIQARHAADGFTFIGINEVVVPFFRNHVNYSAMLVCLIPVTFVLMRMEKRRNVKVVLAGVLLIFFGALFFSYARGAWLALVMGAIGYFMIKKRLLLVSFFLLIVSLVGAIIWLNHEKRYLQYAHDYRSTIYHENFREHLQATYQGKDVSTAERFYRWIAGMKMVEEKPLTGFGPNTFYNNYKEYAIPAYKTWVSKNTEQSTVHNYFLLVAIEQGIPGLVFFLLLLASMFYYCQRLYHKSKDPFNRTVAMCSGVILVMIMTVNLLSDLIETDKIGSLFFLCISVLIITDLRERNNISA